MAPESCAHWSSYVNLLTNLAGEQDELAGAQGPAKRFNAGINEASTKALTPSEAPTPPFVLLSIEDLFIRFMKVFMETTQAQALAEPQECLFKARTPHIYSGKSHMNSYYFYQQCENYFKTLGATGMNLTLFAATFLRGTISPRWV